MQVHKKNKPSVATPMAASGQKAFTKKAIIDDKKKEAAAAQREEQQKYIDESVNQRIREGLHMILTRIQVFIEDQVKAKVSDEVALQMKTLRKEMNSRKASP